ncbi:5,6-dimethylbenzimidazole synthase, partial [Streptomyces sp. NPDC059586]
MTDTGQIPGEGLPEKAGMVEQPGIPAPDAYTFLDPSEHAPEDDDLLLMPASQGAWSDPQTVQPPAAPQAATVAPAPAAEQYQAQQQPQYATQPQLPARGQEAQAPAQAEHGTHESGGRDTGSVDLNGVRIPAPAPVQTPAQVGAPVQAPAPARRPLHRGPASAEAPSYGGGTQGGGVVRSLADRGPAGAVRTAPPARHASPPVTAPEFVQTPAGEAPVLPGPQLGEIPPQGASPWGPPPQPEAPAAEPEAPEAVEAPVGVVPVAVVEPEVAAEAVEPVVVAVETVAPEVAVAAEPVGVAEAPVQPEAPAPVAGVAAVDAGGAGAAGAGGA